MPRRSRIEQRLVKELDTVGAQRAERKEQEELAGKKKIETAAARTKRLEMMQEKEPETTIRPRRTARVGKPLKR